MNTPVFPNPLVQALYLTLAHSLWQGLLLAALTGLIILTTGKATAARRYNLLTAALLLFIGGAVFTLIHVWSQQRAEAAVAATAAYEAVQIQAVVLKATTAAADSSWVQGLVDLCNRNATNIVLLWFAVVGFRSLSLLMGVRSLQQLRHRADFGMAAVWLDMVNNLALRAGVKQAVRLAESAAVQVPMVMGHLKPLILLPAGLVTALPLAEVEAILLHELAHIRRRDYMVNLLQRFTESLFFFNPAVWWLSSLMRAEREHCCDDLTLSQVGSKKHYINALVSCQEYVLHSPACAVALNGGKTNLLHRVKRMVNRKNPSLNLMEKSLLSACLLLSLLLIISLNANPAKGTPRYTPATMAATTNDTTLSVSMMPLAPARRASATTSVTRTQAQTTTTSASDKGDMPLPAVRPVPALPPAAPVKACVAYVQSGTNNQELEDAFQRAEEAREKAEIARRKADRDRMQAEEAGRRADDARRQAEDMARLRGIEARQRAEEARRHAEDVARRQIEDARRKAEDAHRQAETIARLQANKAHLQADEARRRAEEDRRRAEEDRRRADEQRRQGESGSRVILNELIKDGMIGSNDKKISFKLSNNKFVVNGVEQSLPIFRKYQDKYLKASGKSGGGSWSVDYSHSKD